MALFGHWLIAVSGKKIAFTCLASAPLSRHLQISDLEPWSSGLPGMFQHAKHHYLMLAFCFDALEATLWRQVILTARAQQVECCVLMFVTCLLLFQNEFVSVYAVWSSYPLEMSMQMTKQQNVWQRYSCYHSVLGTPTHHQRYSYWVGTSRTILVLTCHGIAHHAGPPWLYEL